MDEKAQFLNAYVAAFLGAHMGQQYDWMCLHSQHDLTNHQPVEDALHVANKAWNQLQTHKKEQGL